LYREYAPRGVAFFNVYSDPAESSSTVRKHDTDYETPFAALLDPVVRRKYNPSHHEDRLGKEAA
jgi:hypothetical protein